MEKFDLLDFLKKIPFLQRLVKWAKLQSFPGFHGVPIYDVIVFIINEILEDDLSTRANSITFSFFIALFPSLLFLFTLIPYLPEAAQYAVDIRQYLKGFLPPSVEEYLVGIIDDLVTRPRSGLLSLGLFFSMFFASNGILSMLKGFHKTYQSSFKSRYWFSRRLIAIALTISIIFIFFSSSLLIVAGGFIIEKLTSMLGLTSWATFGFQLVRWFSVFFLLYTSIAVIYRYGPAFRKKSSLFSIGTTLATLLIILSSIGFSYFVSNFGQYNELYGSIGALIVFLLWLNIICFIILIGFELNASIIVNRDILIAQKDKSDREAQSIPEDKTEKSI